MSASTPLLSPVNDAAILDDDEAADKQYGTEIAAAGLVLFNDYTRRHVLWLQSRYKKLVRMRHAKMIMR